MTGPYYKTNELARLVGVSKNTLIRWEEEGLIPPPMRDGRGWRVWSKDALEKIIELKKSKDLKKPLNGDYKKTIIHIIGYGNQGSVWAKNLRDSGAAVNILLRQGSSSIRTALNDGFEVINIEQGLKQAPKGSVFCLIIPDEEHKKFFKEYESFIDESFVFIFAHGFSVAFQEFKTKARKILLAPKSIAKLIRNSYLDNKTVPVVYSLGTGSASTKQDDLRLVEELSAKLGFAPLISSSFEEETISDLFTEQVIMCGGVPALIIEAFELLKSKGISEEIAVQECLFELSYILEVVKEKGIAGMYQAISPVAASGGYKVFSDIEKGDSLKEVFKKSYADIDNKKFITYFNKTHRDDVMKYIKNKAHNFDTALKGRL